MQDEDSSDPLQGHVEPAARRDVFATEAARSNPLLARTLFNELLKSGRSRAEILDFVNCLLGLVSQHAPREGAAGRAPMIDPKSGLPTRAALHQLLLHELDPSIEHPAFAGLVLLRFGPKSDPALGLRLRRGLRRGDVLAPLGRNLYAGIVYPRDEQGLDIVRDQLRDAAERAGERILAVVSAPIVPGTPAKPLWTGLLKKLSTPRGPSSRTSRRLASF